MEVFPTGGIVWCYLYRLNGKYEKLGLIESFNGHLRDEFLNVNEFIAMQDEREKLKAWQHG